MEHTTQSAGTRALATHADSPLAQGGTLKRRWFRKVETREDALKTINDASAAFFAVAALQAVLGVFLLGPGIFIDVALYVGLAAWLRYGKSRIAAVGLLGVAGISMATTIAAQLKLTIGGTNVILATIVLYAAAKAVEATFKLRGRFKTGLSMSGGPDRSWNDEGPADPMGAGAKTHSKL